MIVSAPYIEIQSTPAVSKTPRANFEEIATQFFSLDYSLSWKKRKKTEIERIAIECSVPGWDGYEAQSINQIAKNAAVQFLEALEINIAQPDIIPLASGYFSFDWYVDPKNQVSVTIKENELVWASIETGERSWGYKVWTNEIPDSLLKIIKSIF